MESQETQYGGCSEITTQFYVMLPYHKCMKLFTPSQEIKGSLPTLFTMNLNSHITCYIPVKKKLT